MSTPSTPSRAASASASSSPSQHSGSPLMLTPTSRVRALLAAFDDNSDDEDATVAEPSIPISSTRPSLGTNELKNAADYVVEFIASDDDKPVKTMTGAFVQQTTSEVVSPTKDSGSNAYARLKQQLLSETTEKLKRTNTKTESSDGSTSESDHDIPVRKTKTIRRSLARSPSKPSQSPSPTPRRSRTTSPGLFVSPTVSNANSPSNRNRGSSHSDSDSLPDRATNPRFQALLAKRRAERLAKEDAQRKKAEQAREREKKEQAKIAKNYKDVFASELDDGMDEEARKALTQNSRPAARKATKKAQEEINRQMQRDLRNQQLAHDAKTKKKITTKDLFKRFNFMQDTAPEDHVDEEQNVLGALISSDVEGHNIKDTPPSSPPSCTGTEIKASTSVHLVENEEDYIIRTGVDHEGSDQELPSIQKFMSQTKNIDKGKGRATESDLPQQFQANKIGKHGALDTKLAKIQGITKTQPKQAPRKLRVIPPPRASQDSDDDLEIIGAKKPSRFAVFDRTPTKKASEAQSFILLRALARVDSPSKGKPAGRNSLNPAELQTRLQERMRQQALAEKEERLNELRARGIIIQTEEERERDQLQLENLLERARNDAQALAKKEKDAAKKNGNGEGLAKDILSDDESEDEDWEEDAEEVELSGSEEGDDDDEVEGGEGVQADGNVFVDNEATENEDEEEAEHTEDGDVDLEPTDAAEDHSFGRLPSKPRSAARARHVIVDEEDEEEQDQPAAIARPSASAERSQLVQPSQDDTIAAFGFNAPQSELGLTQMFKGTMDDLQSQEEDEPILHFHHTDSLDFLRQPPAPTLPDFELAETQPVLVEDSQNPDTEFQTADWRNVPRTQSVNLEISSQSPLGDDMSPTKLSEFPEPTQDAGFEVFSNTEPHSTVETMMMPVAQSPVLEKKGKLRRRNETVAVLSDDEAGSAVEDESASEGEDFVPSKDAFDILFKAAKKTTAVDNFDKKRSDAKNMVEEQAEESEDEYAGLGGASDDESTGEMDEEMKKMIDEGPVDVDETKLAKFYADRDRAEDEKRIDKLYKDITTGGLRRKRGADLDELDDDSDDEAQERRRRKQREFARMRKALLENENIGKIAENPKRLAFLRAIEDRNEEDAFNYLEEHEAEPDSIPDSQNESGDGSSQTKETVPVTDDSISLKRKLPADFHTTDGKENIPPMSHRRRPVDETSKRAKTLAEIREAVSFLIDEPLVPDSQASGSEADSDDEYEGEVSGDEDNLIARTRIRQKTTSTTILRTIRPSVVNRLNVTRTQSEDDILTGAMAFHASVSATTSGGFKIPSLLRRATTNLSTTSNSSTGTTTPVEGGTGVRRGGSKKSNIHYQAREAERRKKVVASEERRREGLARKVVGKGRESVLVRMGHGEMDGFEQ